MESLITFLIVLILSGIGTWIKKLAQKKQEEQDSAQPTQRGQTPPMQRPRPPQKPVTWEDELRRLLGEEEPVITRPRPAAPKPPAPPIVVRPIPAPASPSPLAPPPALVVAKLPAPAVQVLETPVVQTMPPRTQGRLAQADKAEERVSHFDQITAERIKKLPGEHIIAPTAVEQRVQISREATDTISLLKNSRSAREAVIASIILGPPRALEDF